MAQTERPSTTERSARLIVPKALLTGRFVSVALVAAIAVGLTTLSPADATPPQPAVALAGATGAPGGPQTAEQRYLARLDELVAPVRDLTPDPADVQKLKDAVRLNGTADQNGARAIRAQIADPAARKLADWLALRAGAGDVSDFTRFIETNPAWPERNLLQRRAEEQLLSSGGNAQRIKAFFNGGEPRTGSGYAALASAFLAEGNQAEARRFAAEAWRNHDMATSFEKGFLERFGAMLTPADHKRRFDRLLIDTSRFAAERTTRATTAARVVPLLSEPERKKAEARLAIYLRTKTAAPLLAKLPADADGKMDWGLAFQRVQHQRRGDQDEAAWKLLSTTPKDAAALVNPDEWWSERRAAAYDALRAGKYDAAYALVTDGTGLSVNPLKEQAFLAGWIALRFLKKPDVAVIHLEASRTSADGPLSKARGEYWTGRALETLGRKADAHRRYEAAAKIVDSFHGQLARQKLQPGRALDIRVGPPAMPTAEQARRFVELDSVRAAVIATKAGLDRNIRVALFAHLRSHLESEAEVALLAHLAAALGDVQTSLRVGKTGIARGMNLILYAYPVHAFPAYSPLRDPPEKAMLLAIARQETEFNHTIVSSAGARGLLQVMPVTAQHICRDHKIKCDLPRLLTDNAYNATIASAYIGDRMAELRGSYVLGLVAYNAGPGRARQWIRELGDPREANVDPIDWIERIPIEETREYVKKVLSNVQVYRARLDDATALRLEDDLVRRTDRR